MFFLSFHFSLRVSFLGKRVCLTTDNPILALLVPLPRVDTLQSNYIISTVLRITHRQQQGTVVWERGCRFSLIRKRKKTYIGSALMSIRLNFELQRRSTTHRSHSNPPQVNTTIRRCCWVTWVCHNRVRVLVIVAEDRTCGAVEIE